MIDPRTSSSLTTTSSTSINPIEVFFVNKPVDDEFLVDRKLVNDTLVYINLVGNSVVDNSLVEDPSC